MRRVQQSDVTTAPRAYTSDVTFSEFLFQSTTKEYQFIFVNFRYNRCKQQDLTALFRILLDHPSYYIENHDMMKRVIKMLRCIIIFLIFLLVDSSK